MEQKFSEFMESDKSLKHDFKDTVPHMCLAGAVVSSWSLTQEVLARDAFCCNFVDFSKFTENI